MKGVIMISGGGAKLFAAIGVTYPEGSTCTCTNGTKTLKAKTTSGQWVFAIPEAGTWTVTATDGTNTKSESVNITAEGQSVNVELSYRTEGYLYNAGVFNESYQRTEEKSNGTITYNSNNFSVATTTGSNSAYAFVIFEDIEIDGQSAIEVVATPNSDNGSNSGIAIVLLPNGKTLNGSDPSANAAAYYHQNGNASTAKNYSLDVSKVTAGIYDLAVGFTTAGGAWKDKRRYDINSVNVH